MAMPMKMRERREEERLRTITAIRPPRHPLQRLYFDIGKSCLCLLERQREVVGGLATTGSSCHGKPWAAATLRASAASHGGGHCLYATASSTLASYATSMPLAVFLLMPLMVQL